MDVKKKQTHTRPRNGVIFLRGGNPGGKCMAGDRAVTFAFNQGKAGGLKCVSYKRGRRWCACSSRSGSPGRQYRLLLGGNLSTGRTTQDSYEFRFRVKDLMVPLLRQTRRLVPLLRPFVPRFFRAVHPPSPPPRFAC